MPKIGGDGLDGAPGPADPLPRGPKYWCEQCEQWVSHYIAKRSALTGDILQVYDPEKAKAEHVSTHIGVGNEAADLFAGHPDLLALDAELGQWYG
mgnify:CR=1 FL=1